MKKTLKIFVFVYLLTITVSGCRKLLEVDLPIGSVTSQGAFDNVQSAISAVTGLYLTMRHDADNNFVGTSGIAFVGGQLADELRPENGSFSDTYVNALNGREGAHIGIWKNTYQRALYRCNSVLEGLSASEVLPLGVKKQLTGEAKFVRAMLYFYLVNFYGDIPLVLSTDFTNNSKIPRSPIADIYKQITSDLTDAQALLPDYYSDATLTGQTPDRLRPNKASATALLARVYLYLENWTQAEMQATAVINDHGKYELLSDLSTVFIKNSRETIWALEPNDNDPEGPNTLDARAFLRGSDQPVCWLNNSLLDDFEHGDKRRVQWVIAAKDFAGNTVQVPYKYRLGSINFYPSNTQQNEYYVVLRLAEQYLIRAEARAHAGQLTGINSAAEDLNTVRGRAGLLPVSVTTKEEMLDAILQERRVELFAEFSHRWFDLKRTKKIDEVMGVQTTLKGGQWAPFKSLLPIPVMEFKLNAALIGHQNPGYTEQ